MHRVIHTDRQTLALHKLTPYLGVRVQCGREKTLTAENVLAKYCTLGNIHDTFISLFYRSMIFSTSSEFERWHLGKPDDAQRVRTLVVPQYIIIIFPTNLPFIYKG